VLHTATLRGRLDCFVAKDIPVTQNYGASFCNSITVAFLLYHNYSLHLVANHCLSFKTYVEWVSVSLALKVQYSSAPWHAQGFREPERKDVCIAAEINNPPLRWQKPEHQLCVLLEGGAVKKY